MQLKALPAVLAYPRAHPRYLGVIAALPGLAILPFVLPPFELLFATEILILILFTMSFNLLFGYTGLLSFGHAAYFGIGAYSASLILLKVFPSLPLAIVGAMLSAALAALVIGYFCVRLNEIYFAMLTLAFAQMVYTIVWQWDELTGGSDGLLGIPQPPIGIGDFAVSLDSYAAYYYWTASIVVLAIFVLWRLVNSPFGLTLRVMRENPERAEFVGIPVKRYRLMSFVIAGTLGGLAGALAAPFERTATPEMFYWTKSAEPVLMSLLGGIKVFFGPAVGVGVFEIMKEVISSQLADYWMLPMGLIVIALVLFFPGGIVGAFAQRRGG